MAILSVHHPLVFAFGVLGNLISFLVYLAPTPTFYRIYRKKSTEVFQSLPYLVALFSSMLWLYYAMLKKDALLLMTINSFGCVIETIYIIIYITYAPKEKRVSTVTLLVSMNMGLFSFILLLTHFLVEGSVRITILGWINMAISVSVFAAPLSIVAQVIRTKSVEFMPFTLSLCLTLSAVMWFAYGLFSKDLYVTIPNVVGFVLGLLQMLLYAIYRGPKIIAEENKLPEQLKSIVILSTLGTCDVHPIDIQSEGSGDAGEQIDTEWEHNKKDEKSMEATDDLQENECAV